MSIPLKENVLVLAFFGGLILQWIVGFILHKWVKEIKFKALYVDLSLAIAPLRAIIPAAALFLAVPLSNLHEPFKSFFEHFLQLWVMGCLGWLLTRMVAIARVSMLHRYEVANADYKVRRIYTQVRIIEHILDLMIWVLTLALMVMTFSEVKELGMSIFASAGIMSVIIGLAAQKTLGNVIAGIQIAISQPIRLEDGVIVEGEFGFIEEITLTYVVVRLWDLRRMILPISYFIEKPFQNWTRTSTEMLGSVFFYVDYTVPMEPLRQELRRILEQSKLWGKKVCTLQISDMKQNTVELRALMDASSAGALWDLRCEVREKLLKFLTQAHPEAVVKSRIENISAPPAG